MKRLLAILLFAFALACSSMGGTVLPMNGGSWQLWDYAAAGLCGVASCGAGQSMGTLPKNGGIYFDFPNAPNSPAETYMTNPQFAGTGLNDANWNDGYYTGTASISYCVRITAVNVYEDAAGWHDAYSWGTGGSCTNGGSTYMYGTGGGGNYLSHNVLIAWASSSGHTVGDEWTVEATVGTKDSDWRGYLMYPGSLKFTEAQTAKATIQLVTTGSPVFGWESNVDNLPPGCASPPAARLYIQSGSWNYTAPDGSNRWWSNPVSFTLASGTATLSVPLQPDQWSDTYGQEGDSSPTTEKEFAEAIANVNFIGMTFGGGCFFGHGVNISGPGATAQFILKSFTIQ